MSKSDWVSVAMWTMALLSPVIGYHCARLEKRGRLWRGWGFPTMMLVVNIPQFVPLVLYFTLKGSG